MEVAFSNYKYTRRILCDYSTNNKIHKAKYKSINRLVYAVCYAFMGKSVRTSISTYKDNGVAPLKALHIKCASVDSKTRQRAKQDFMACKIAMDKTSIGFLSRLERKANEARNYDIKISEKKFIKTLLDNMKHHRYYKNIVSALLTNYELNNEVFNQRWLENKFYTMDEERILNFKGRHFKHEVRFVNSAPTTNNKTSSGKMRCKYCYKPGHIDDTCRDKAQKSPPTMPDWVANITCTKYKKKGHMAFNCPPKYNNQKKKSPKFNRFNKYRKKTSENKEKTEKETASVAKV